MGRTIEDIICDEKPSVVAKAEAKARQMLRQLDQEFGISFTSGEQGVTQPGASEGSDR